MPGIDYSQIFDELWVGAAPGSPDDVLHLMGLGVDAVLCLQSDMDFAQRGIQWDLLWRFYVSQGVKIVRYPIQDFDPDDLTRRLDGAVETLSRLLADGRHVYLHCTAGWNRSPTVAIAWLMKHRGMDVDEAEEFFYERRQAQPYPEVLAWWAKHLRR